MANYKEIVTKAVIGKGKRVSGSQYTIMPEEKANTVLGCWVINHEFNGTNNKNEVTVKGTFDVNVWYSYANDTKTTVSTKTFNYDEVMKIRLKENADVNSNMEIIVRSLKQPTVTKVDIENDNVVINVEKELGVEVIGDTKVKVMADDNFDDYDIIEEELSKEETEEIDNIDENYLNE